MATEKQAAYINSLIEDLRIEKMEWVARLTLTGKHREWKLQLWIDDAMNTRTYEKEVLYADALNAYNARLDEIAGSIDAMDTREASKAIDNLKRCRIVW